MIEHRLIEYTGAGETLHERLEYRQAPYLSWKTVKHLPLITLEEQASDTWQHQDDQSIPDYGIN